jgi:hypothetical protein
MRKIKELHWLDDETWELLPEEIQKDKMKFNTFNSWIKKREKRIENLKIKIGELREKQREWETDRDEIYDKLHKYHKEYGVSVSPTQSPKHSKNSLQWRVNLTIGKESDIFYLGSNKLVRKKVDEVQGWVKYFPDNHKNKDSEDIKSFIKQKIHKRILGELEKDFDGFMEKFKSKEKGKKLNLIDYLG